MMNNLNSVLIEGNLIRDPELKYTQKGSAVCAFVLASNRYFKQDEETQKEVSFFEVTTWSRLAEVCGEYLKKGRGVRVVGRLKQDRWTSPEGQARSKISIVAEHVEFKPQLKGKDGDGKDESATEAEGKAEAADEQVQEEGELKEAASF
jgi:single-strand DNA-binding protein